MALVGWCIVLMGIAAAAWLAAAFLLHLRQAGRFAVTAFLPVLAAMALTMFYFLSSADGPDTDEVRRWKVVFLIVSLVVSSFAALPAAMIWLLMENRLGDRAR